MARSTAPHKGTGEQLATSFVMRNQRIMDNMEEQWCGGSPKLSSCLCSVGESTGTLSGRLAESLPAANDCWSQVTTLFRP